MPGEKLFTRPENEVRATAYNRWHGVTWPISLDATFYGAGRMPAAMAGQVNIDFRATGTIMRSQLGLTTGIPMIGDAVKFDTLAALKKAQG